MGDSSSDVPLLWRLAVCLGFGLLALGGFATLIKGTSSRAESLSERRILRDVKIRT